MTFASCPKPTHVLHIGGPEKVIFTGPVLALLVRELGLLPENALQNHPGSQALDLRIHKYHSVLGTACVTHVAGELAWVLNIHQPRVWILTIHQPHEIARFLHTCVRRTSEVDFKV